MSKRKKKKAPKVKDTSSPPVQSLATQVSEEIKKLNLPPGTRLFFCECDCKRRVLFLDQAQRKLDRGLVRQLGVLCENFVIGFSTKLKCSSCGKAVTGNVNRRIEHAGQATLDQEVQPAAVLAKF